jgi:hypothetical protein
MAFLCMGLTWLQLSMFDLYQQGERYDRFLQQSAILRDGYCLWLSIQEAKQMPF